MLPGGPEGRPGVAEIPRGESERRSGNLGRICGISEAIPG